jgi:hypothetical protein
VKRHENTSTFFWFIPRKVSLSTSSTDPVFITSSVLILFLYSFLIKFRNSIIATCYFSLVINICMLWYILVLWLQRLKADLECDLCAALGDLEMELHKCVTYDSAGFVHFQKHVSEEQVRSWNFTVT